MVQINKPMGQDQNPFIITTGQYNVDTYSREDDIEEAEVDKVTIKAMIELLRNNKLSCEVEIMGLTHGMSNNSFLIPALENELIEIDRFLAGLPNTWE